VERAWAEYVTEVSINKLAGRMRGSREMWGERNVCFIKNTVII